MNQLINYLEANKIENFNHEISIKNHILLKTINIFEINKYAILSDILIWINKKNISVDNKNYTNLVTSECFTLGLNCLDFIKKSYFYTNSLTDSDINELYFSQLLKNKTFKYNKTYYIMTFFKTMNTFKLELTKKITEKNIDAFLSNFNLNDIIIHDNFDLIIENEVFCLYNKSTSYACSIVSL